MKPTLAPWTRWQVAATAALCVLLVAFVWFYLRPHAMQTTSGFAAYYTASRILANAPQDLAAVYDPEWFAAAKKELIPAPAPDVFGIQPPTMSLLLLPLARLPHETARLIWLTSSLLFLIGGLLLLADALLLPRRWGLWVTPALILFTPVREVWRLGQAYLFLFLLLCIVFWTLLRRADASRASRVGGLALGSMAILKTAGLWLWPILLVGRRWRLIVWAAVAATATALLFLLRSGPAPWLIYLSQLPMLATMPERGVTAYQTVTSLFLHLFAYDSRFSPAPVADWPRLAVALTLATQLVTLAATARWQRLHSDRHAERALSAALAAAPITVNAPVGEGYHVVLALPSLLVAVWWGWQIRADRWARGILAGIIVLLAAPLAYTSPALAVGWWTLLAYPRVYGAYLLWGWLLWATRRLSGDGPALDPTDSEATMSKPPLPIFGKARAEETENSDVDCARRGLPVRRLDDEERRGRAAARADVEQ